MSEPGFDECADSEPKPLAARHVVAAVMGNALEFYDFTVYVAFSISIGHAFFPNLSEHVSLSFALLIFAAGFITRPIGGLVIGAFGDRVGRNPPMLLSFRLMGS